ncbi:hypothetical protein Hte_000574 [Hypoxylon texense]
MVYLVIHETATDIVGSRIRPGCRAVVGAYPTVLEANVRVLGYVEAVAAQYHRVVAGVRARATVGDLLEEGHAARSRYVVVLGGADRDVGASVWGSAAGAELCLWYRRPDLESPPCRVRVVTVNPDDFRVTNPATAVDGCCCQWCLQRR